MHHKLQWKPCVLNFPFRRSSTTTGGTLQSKGPLERSYQPVGAILGKTWCGIVGREKKALKIDSRVKINVRVYPPDRRKRDIDGYLKALLDSLTHAGVWLDDEQVDSIYITRGEVVKGGKAVVEILPMGE